MATKPRQDIVTRLRQAAGGHDLTALEAADELQRLRAQLTEAQALTRRTICVYCGKVQQFPEPVDWDAQKEQMIRHIDECEAHPLRRAAHELADTKQALAEAQRERDGAMAALRADSGLIAQERDQAWQALAEAQRERDEARAKAEDRAIFCMYCGEAVTYAGPPDNRDFPRVIAEATAHDAVCGKNPIVAALAEARTALESVEWDSDELGDLYCPWCGHAQAVGHAPNCLRQRALALAGGHREDA